MSQGQLSAPKQLATVPVAQSTPTKPSRSVPKPSATVPSKVFTPDSGASASTPCALVPPTESVNTKVGEDPKPSTSSAQPSGNTGEGGSVAAKVSRIPKRPHAPEINPEQGPSYAKKAAEDLDMAIVDMRDNNQLSAMSDDRFAKLQGAISKLLIAQSKKTKTVPRFEENKLVSGVMRLKCTSSYSRHWLERNVPNLAHDQLWPGVNLSVIGLENIPKPIKCSVFLPSIQESTRDIFGLLEASNEGISTRGWSLMHRVHKSGGTFMKLGIDSASRDALCAHGYKLFCGLGGKATFKLTGKDVPEPNTQPPGGQPPRVQKKKGGNP